MLSSNYNTLLTHVTSERKVLLQDKIHASTHNTTILILQELPPGGSSTEL
jgi:hypothetical protein